jgi:type IV secretion system protein VirB2
MASHSPEILLGLLFQSDITRNTTMSPLNIAALGRTPLAIVIVAATSDMPTVAMAQSSPFLTGATALQSNIISWLTPIAVILIMALGGMAMANRMSWGWCVGAILGIAIAFGAPQIVTWVRGMFGV